MTLPDFAEPLTAFLRTELADDQVEVSGGRRLSGGASRETFEITLSGSSHERLAMQRVRPGALSSTFSMVREADLMRAAGGRGVPVAPVVAASDDPEIAGAPFTLTGWVDGETIARRILRDDRFATARTSVVAQSARALAAVHTIPTEDTALPPPSDVVSDLYGLFRSLREPHPAFELAFRWLQSAPPDAGNGVAVVHGDFRLGNLMIDDEGLVAVLDWELAHLGDPMEDLGWFCVKAWRFGAAPPVAGLGPYEELFEAYEAASGQPVDPAVVRWWEVYGTLRWGVICILQAKTHLSGASRSVELAAIGRRVCENEYDLLELLP